MARRTATSSALGIWCSTLWIEVPPSFPEALRPALEAQVRQSLPLECAGLLVIRGGRTWAMALPTTASAMGFAVHPRLWVETLTILEHRGIEIWATYHSHPGGRLRPSRRDHALHWTSKRLLLLAPSGLHVAIAQYEWTASSDNQC
ncbi:Mov34/MPN/PAD-1 family protein [Alicyclobacillus sendaiensis]|uniref:Mov34/MPN/PAD-1 family protein n=1 Tax=Alicyclobacillus sendaiensis PA2 TaxID=3029425 RepID=A0ABT6XYL3_ALISE|nr:Mov34/MPN/PAD-1 family protein [Alicyclobacillus sendaiensis]MDI9259877.1 Mov34/MPN/PAD-1 family protein [Alicyclobacillus sendaiensis PA2]